MIGEIPNNIFPNQEKQECTHRLLRNMFVGFFVFIGIVILLVPSGWSKTIHVPSDSATIQSGIDGARDGDTVLVTSGTYVENIDFMGKAILLKSEQGPNVTIIDGGSPAHPDSGSVVIFKSGEQQDSKLEGFKITNGSGTYAQQFLGYLGGGVCCTQNSCPTIASNIITGNRSDSYVLLGGGIYCGDGSSPTIIHNKITENSSNSGVFDSGIYCGSGTSPAIMNNSITGNSGGIICYGSSPEITVNQISDNQAAEGGGINCQHNASPTIINNTITGNWAWIGGGIRCDHSSPTIIENRIVGNVAAGAGGEGGGIYCERSSPSIKHNFISGNTGAFRGGGICCQDHSSPEIANNVIVGNVSNGHLEGGGGIYCRDSFPTVLSNTIAENLADSGGRGGGLYCDGDSALTVKNTIFWGNDASQSHEIHCPFAGPTVTFCNIQAGWSGEGNIDQDPLFRNPDNGDYHLMATYCGDSLDSPCIDAGDPNVLDDSLDCWHGLGTSRSDMGAYAGANAGWPIAVKEDESEVGTVPKDFVLFQNYPNPFNSVTVLRYSLPRSGIASLSIYNVLGQRVATLVDGFTEAGEHGVVWDASGFSSGIYLARLEVGAHSRTIKMVLLQ